MTCFDEEPEHIPTKEEWDAARRGSEGWYCTECDLYHGQQGHDDMKCKECGALTEYWEFGEHLKGHNED